MATKGYWLKQAKIESTAQFIEYVKTVVPWLRSVGGTIIAKDVNQNSDLISESRQNIFFLNKIIKFSQNQRGGQIAPHKWQQKEGHGGQRNATRHATQSLTTF